MRNEDRPARAGAAGKVERPAVKEDQGKEARGREGIREESPPSRSRAAPHPGTSPGGPENGGPPSSAGEENPINVSRRRRDMPNNLWMQCTDCGKMIYKPRVQEKLFVCPECNFHFEIASTQRILTFLDPDTFEEHFRGLSPLDPLGFVAQKP